MISTLLKKILVVLCVIISTKAADVTLSLSSSNQLYFATNWLYTNFNARVNTNDLYSTNIINVLNYGAVGDGVTDNTVSISNAWTAANGKVLLFPPGTYLTKTLSLGTYRSNITVLGRNATVSAYETNTIGMLFGGTNITFQDITFNWLNKVRLGLYPNVQTKGLRFYNVKLLNVYGDNNIDPSGNSVVSALTLNRGMQEFSFVNSVISNVTFSTVGNSSRAAKGIFCSALGGSFPTDASSKFILANSFFYNVWGDTNSEGDSVEFTFPNGSEDYQVNIIGNIFSGYTKRAVKMQHANFNIVANQFDSLLTTDTPSMTLAHVGAFGRGLIANNSMKGSMICGVWANTTSGNNGATNIIITGNVIHGYTNTYNLMRGIDVGNTGAGNYATNVLVANNIIDNFYTGLNARGGAKNVHFLNNMVLNAKSEGAKTVTDTGVPTEIYFRNNYFDGATNGINAVNGTKIVSTFNTGSSSGTFINYTGATGYHGFNGDLPIITTATLDFGAINAAASADLTIAVTGAAVGDTVSVALPASPTAGIIFNSFVSATDTVTVRASNITAAPVDPASASYTVQVFKQ